MGTMAAAFTGTRDQWQEILMFIHTNHHTQVRNLILAQYWSTYGTWCFGRHLVLNAKSQVCFWTYKTDKQIETLRQTKARPVSFYTGATIREVVNDYIDAGMPLHKLHAALTTFMASCHAVSKVDSLL